MRYRRVAGSEGNPFGSVTFGIGGLVRSYSLHEVQIARQKNPPRDGRQMFNIARNESRRTCDGQFSTTFSQIAPYRQELFFVLWPTFYHPTNDHLITPPAALLPIHATRW